MLAFGYCDEEPRLENIDISDFIQLESAGVPPLPSINPSSEVDEAKR
jgi:hypothetical protein